MTIYSYPIRSHLILIQNEAFGMHANWRKKFHRRNIMQKNKLISMSSDNCCIYRRIACGLIVHLTLLNFIVYVSHYWGFRLFLSMERQTAFAICRPLRDPVDANVHQLNAK